MPPLYACRLTGLYRELSNGHFSDDNHKRLTGASISVPLYEAKMTRDSRLVVGIVVSRHSRDLTEIQYQVDCVPDFDSQVSHVALALRHLLNSPRLNVKV